MTSTTSTTAVPHTFVNELVQLSENLDRWEKDNDVDKSDMAKHVRTHLLKCMRAALVHPFTSFYSLEASTVVHQEGGAGSAVD